MEVIYKKQITEKIQSAIHEGKNLNKEIDHIILTDEEWEKLLMECGECRRDPMIKSQQPGSAVIFGIPVFKQDF